jgi:Caspase domain
MPTDDVRRALLVGIDSYQYLNPLSGCVNDVLSLTPLLQRDAEGDKNFGCRALVSGRDAVDDQALLDGLDELLSPGAHVALFYFAGHGGRAARVIEPVGTDHLYYAAIESKPCKLTPLGMHYWRTHQDG